MKSKIGIVNYGISGNIHSINKALQRAGATTHIINDAKEFGNVDKLILPGVGSFKDAMTELQNDGLIAALTSNQKPLLGICLGMQILSNLGYEYGRTQGLGLIEAEVKPMIVDAKVPHMGFGAINVQKENVLLRGLENEVFYFMHSYEVVNYTNILALSSYAGHSFVSAIQKEHIFGVQFHPEKSRDAGIELFKNFIGI